MKNASDRNTEGRSGDADIDMSANDSWETLHDLALVFLHLAHGADGCLDPMERHTLLERLQDWQGELGGRDPVKILDEVLLIYMTEARGALVDAAIISLRDELSREQRYELLNDLAHLVMADGMIVQTELGFLQQVAQRWDVDREFGIS